jgi:hypothetical protein
MGRLPSRTSDMLGQQLSVGTRVAVKRLAAHHEHDHAPVFIGTCCQCLCADAPPLHRNSEIFINP